MLYPEADGPHLKRWIINRLGDTSDADSDILADYVLALLKHEDTDGALSKEMCAAELQDFFQEGTADSEKFVDELFLVIKYKSYLPGAPPPPDRNAPPLNAPTGPRNPNSVNRKRKVDNAMDINESPIASKVARASTHGQSNYVGPRGPPQNWVGGYPTPSAGGSNKQLDFNALANMALANQNILQMLASAISSDGKKGKKGKRKKICHEWEKTGTCSKGEQCKYPHEGIAGDAPSFSMSMIDGFDFNGVYSRSDRKTRGGKSRERIYDIEPGRIYIKNIPDEHFDEKDLREFFSRFGEIEDVVLQAHNNTVLIRFVDHFAALAAIDSPKPVFDNRFVSVVAAKKPRVESEDPINLDEFRKKQEDTQRAWEEKKRLRDELAAELDEITRKETELRMNQLELKRRIAEKEGRSGEEGDMDGLRAQLAALEHEALTLGIVNGSEFGDYAENNQHPYGGYRGRGGWRGRSSYRGKYRGDIHQAYRGATLDNRPKTVEVRRIDFTVESHSEALRQYLMSVGTFNDIRSTPDATQIFFNDRRTAESFWAKLATNPIPGLSGELELSWVANRPAKKGDTQTYGGINSSGLSATAQAFVPGAVFKEEIPYEEDYDVADDNDWN